MNRSSEHPTVIHMSSSPLSAAYEVLTPNSSQDSFENLSTFDASDRFSDVLPTTNFPHRPQLETRHLSQQQTSSFINRPSYRRTSSFSSTMAGAPGKDYLYYKVTKNDADWSGDVSVEEIPAPHSEIKKKVDAASRSGKVMQLLRSMGPNRRAHINRLIDTLNSNELGEAIWEPVFIENTNAKTKRSKVEVRAFEMILAKRLSRSSNRVNFGSLSNLQELPEARDREPEIIEYIVEGSERPQKPKKEKKEKKEKKAKEKPQGSRRAGAHDDPFANDDMFDIDGRPLGGRGSMHAPEHSLPPFIPPEKPIGTMNARAEPTINQERVHEGSPNLNATGEDGMIDDIQALFQSMSKPKKRDNDIIEVDDRDNDKRTFKHDRDQDRNRDRSRDRDRTRNHNRSRGRDNEEDWESNQDRDRDRDHYRADDRDREHARGKGHNKGKERSRDFGQNRGHSHDGNDEGPRRRAQSRSRSRSKSKLRSRSRKRRGSSHQRRRDLPTDGARLSHRHSLRSENFVSDSSQASDDTETVFEEVDELSSRTSDDTFGGIPYWHSESGRHGYRYNQVRPTGSKRYDPPENNRILVHANSRQKAMKTPELAQYQTPYGVEQKLIRRQTMPSERATIHQVTFPQRLSQDIPPMAVYPQYFEDRDRERERQQRERDREREREQREREKERERDAERRAEEYERRERMLRDQEEELRTQQRAFRDLQYQNEKEQDRRRIDAMQRQIEDLKLTGAGSGTRRNVYNYEPRDNYWSGR